MSDSCDVDIDSQMSVASDSDAEDSISQDIPIAAKTTESAAPLADPIPSETGILPARSNDDTVENDEAMARRLGAEEARKLTTGSKWSNQKSQEERQRAWALLEDKQFSLKEFGDPFLDKSELMEGGP